MGVFEGWSGVGAGRRLGVGVGSDLSSSQVDSLDSFNMLGGSSSGSGSPPIRFPGGKGFAVSTAMGGSVTDITAVHLFPVKKKLGIIKIG